VIVARQAAKNRIWSWSRHKADIDGSRLDEYRSVRLCWSEAPTTLARCRRAFLQAALDVVAVNNLSDNSGGS